MRSEHGRGAANLAFIPILLLALGSLLTTYYSLPAQAAVGINKQINFQGKVVNPNGTNVANGSYTFLFRLYSSTSGDTGSPCLVTCLWEESKSLTVTDGVFQTNLGDTTTLPGGVNFNTDNIYLGMKFNNDSAGEMSPRVRFTAVPQAFNSDSLDGLDSSAFGQLGSTQTWTGTNTFQPTTNLSSLIAKQNSSGFFGQDVFSVQGSGSGNFIQVTSTAANAGAVTVQSLGSNALTLESGGVLNVGPANATAINLGRTGLGVIIPATGVVAVSLTGVPAASTISSLIQLSAAIAGGSANGTYIGANPSSFSGDFANFQVGGASRLAINSFGDITSGFTNLDGSSTTNGAAIIASTSMTVTSGTNFDVGNYIKLDNTGGANCSGAVVICYAKITAKATNVLTISPGLIWATGKNVTEVHIPEVGGTNLASTLTNRYGQGYFINGVTTGNGSTEYTDGSITSNVAGFNLLNTTVTTLNIGGAATTISLGASGAAVSIPGNLNVTGTLTAPGPATGTSGHFTRSGTSLSPAVGGDAITTSGNISTSGTGTITSAGAFSGPTGTNTINGLVVNGGALTNVGANITGAGAVTLASGAASALNLTGAAASTWDIGANTLSLQTVGNGAITTGTGLVTHGGNTAVNGGSLTTTSATANLFNANATTLNLGSAATTVTLGATTGTLNLRNPIIDTPSSTLTLFNTTATTVNFAGAATTLSVGAASGTTTFAGKIVDARNGTGTGDSTFQLSGAPVANATSSQIRLGAAIASGNNTAGTGGTYIGLNAPSSGAGSAADFLNFQNNGVSQLKLDSTGKATIQGTAGYNQASGCTTLANITAIGGFITAATCSVSDARFKNNIQTVQGALAGVGRLRAVTYDFNQLYRNVTGDTNDHGVQYGLLAQELEQVFPGLVKPVYGDYKTINYLGLTAVLAKAIQELDAKVDRQLMQGSDADFGVVNIGGLASIGDLNVKGIATIASLRVTGNATIDGDLVLAGHIVGNADTRGEVSVAVGQTSVRHNFAHPYSTKPYVVASPIGQKANYWLDVDESGFTVNLDTPVKVEMQFNYLVSQ